MKPAIPDYLVNYQFDETPPGHRFSLFMSIWSDRDFELEKNRKTAALRKTLSISSATMQQVHAIRQRQLMMAINTQEEQRLLIDAISTAPMATGMGLEHPLENGFAFLNPYGIAYLPGSSIKGVLRRAAEELMHMDEKWMQDDIDNLFGPETQKDNEARRGALVFWDVIPEVSSMGIEIMTPHYADYYQGNASPHDSGQPTPIPFMVVPADAKYRFIVMLNPHYRQKGINWKMLMQQAFEYAFDWQGFGAKTAVGYGAMRVDIPGTEQREQELRDSQKRQKELAQLAAMTPLEREIEEICQQDKNNPAVTLFNHLKNGQWEKSDDQQVVAQKIKILWQAEKKWNPGFSGTNKQKVKQRDRCQKVLKYLDSD